MAVILWNAKESEDYVLIYPLKETIIVRNQTKKVISISKEKLETIVLDLLTLLSDVMFIYQNLEEVFISFDRNILIVQSSFRGESNTDCFSFSNMNIYREDIYRIIGETLKIDETHEFLKEVLYQKRTKKDYFVIEKMVEDYYDRHSLKEKAEQFQKYFQSLSVDEQKEVFTDFIAAVKIVDALDTYSMKKAKKII